MENEFDATESSGAKQMRETIERKDKEVKELEAKLASYQEKELNQVFEEVGLDTQKGFGKALKQVYDGPIETEAIAKFAKDEYGFEAKGIVEEARSLAREEAQKIAKTSAQQLEQEINAAREKLKSEVAAMSLLCAEKIISKEIDKKMHDKIIDEVVNK